MNALPGVGRRFRFPTTRNRPFSFRRVGSVLENAVVFPVFQARAVIRSRDAGRLSGIYPRSEMQSLESDTNGAPHSTDDGAWRVVKL